jgi:hypothetical protein
MSEELPSGVRAFRAAIEPAVIEDVRSRVRGAWLPDPIAPGWEHGTDVEAIRSEQGATATASWTQSSRRMTSSRT